MSDVLNLIDELGEEENSLTERVFISPIFFNTQVVTRVLGMNYTFNVPKKSPGWYHIRPIDSKRATVTGEADMMQIEEYLKLLPKLRIVVVQKIGDVYCGLPLKNNKFGLSHTDSVPICLTDDTVVEFDQVQCRFDGANVWYEGPEISNDPAKGEYLRDCMEKFVEPKNIKLSGLTLEEKSAYTIRVTLDKKFREDRKKSSLQNDVEHAGGKFINFQERRDNFSVTYEVDGHRYTSHIAKDVQHSVITAGICLSGGDREFDLKSLITVLREGQHRHLIHRY